MLGQQATTGILRALKPDDSAREASLVCRFSRLDGRAQSTTHDSAHCWKSLPPSVLAGSTEVEQHDQPEQKSVCMLFMLLKIFMT
jgi:hypothetical protein